MSEQEHTNGPWFVGSKFVVGPRDDSDTQSFGMVIGVADVYGDNREQDARLIAAAPDMAADGKFLLDRLEEFERDLSDGEFFRDWSGHVAPAISRFRAAISKALTP